MPKLYGIGDWTFAPDSHELRRGGERVRLEHRTSRALELLCERGGETVPKTELAERLWGGRQVSPNSLSVVIGDLRKALGDDARAPRFVETVAKAGYRLVAGVSLSPAPRREWRRAASVAAATAMVAGLVGWAWMAERGRGPVVLVERVANATGDPRYDGLAKASDALLVSNLSQRPGLRVRRVAAGARSRNIGGRVVRLTARLVLWTGLPDLELSAENPETSEVLWSGRAWGPEPTLPRKLDQQISGLARVLDDGRGKIRPRPRV